MQQPECESNSITCMSCLYVHVYGNKVISIYLYICIWHCRARSVGGNAVSGAGGV